MRGRLERRRPRSRGPVGAVVLAAALAFAAGASRAAGPPDLPAEGVVAVLPPENLGGSPAPLAEIRGAFRVALEERSIRVLDEATLDSFLASRRLRHTGGLSAEAAKALLEETGAGFALITSVDLHEDSPHPKVAMTSRLVSAGREAEIVWMDSVDAVAAESPGLLGMHRAGDAGVLRERVIVELADGVAARFREPTGASGKVGEGAPRAARRFRPRTFHRSPGPAPGEGRIRVAVMPFRNDSGRADAGNLVALQFVRRLAAWPGVEVVEPGVVREVLLRARLIQAEGISLPQADLVRELLDADVVVAGRVDEWRDAPGDGLVPSVSFSARGIDTRTRRVVWASTTGCRGDRGVFFFGVGRKRTANALAAEIVLGVVERALGERRGAPRSE